MDGFPWRGSSVEVWVPFALGGHIRVDNQIFLSFFLFQFLLYKSIDKIIDFLKKVIKIYSSVYFSVFFFSSEMNFERV